MSAEALAWAKNVELPEWHVTTDKLILMMLADRADEYGFCWISGAKLCQQVGVIRSTLTRRLKWLEGVYIYRVRRHRPNGSQTSNLWILDMGRSSAETFAILDAIVAHDGDPLDAIRLYVQRAQESCASVHTPEEDFQSSSLDVQKSRRRSRGKRDPIWDALTELFGEATTETSRSLRGKIRRSLEGAGATGPEIKDRAKRWPKVMPVGATLTETALEKHWPLLASRNGGQAAPPCAACGIGGGHHAADCPTVNTGKEGKS